MADETGNPQDPSSVEETNRFLKEQERLLKSRLEILEGEQAAATVLNATLAEKLSIEQKIHTINLELEEIQRSLREEVDQSLKKQLDIKEEILERARETYDHESKQLTQRQLLKKITTEELKNYKKAEKEIRKIRAEQAIPIRARAASTRLSAQISAGLQSRTPKLLENIKDIVATGQGGFKAEGTIGAMKHISRALGGLSGVMLGLAKAVEFVVSAVMGVRRELVEINRVTLGNKEISEVYNDIATDTSQAASMAYKFGVTTKEVGKTLTEMYKENSAIQGLIESAGTEAASQLSIVATKYKDFGISASQAAQVVDIATRSMGMGASQTTELMKGLVEEASLAAQSPDKFVSSFVTQYPKLRIYGDRSKEIFTKINKEASDIGVSFDAITGIGRSFESYESAAMASTQLNMLLGSNFDALQAMAATPEELTGMLRQNISENDLRQMSHFQRRYLANILNVEYDQLERIVSGKEAKDREQQRFDMLAESATHDSQRVESLLENLKTGIGSAVNSLGVIEKAIKMVAGVFVKDEELRENLTGTLEKEQEENRQKQRARVLQELAGGSIRSILDLGIKGVDENELNFLRATANSQVKTAEKMLERMNITKEDNTKIIEILNDVRDGNSTTKEMVAVLGKLVTMFEDGSAKTISSLE